MKADTIPINVFLSTSLQCLFNTAPGGPGPRSKPQSNSISFGGRKRDVTATTTTAVLVAFFRVRCIVGDSLPTARMDGGVGGLLTRPDNRALLAEQTAVFMGLLWDNASCSRCSGWCFLLGI